MSPFDYEPKDKAMDFSLKELDFIREGLLRQIRTRQAGARRQTKPSKAGDRKGQELDELMATLDKVAGEIRNRLLPNEGA